MTHISKLTTTTALALIIAARFGARGAAVAQAWNAVAAEISNVRSPTGSTPIYLAPT